MPLYEYTCNQCKASFELFLRSIKEEPVCPKCNAKDLSRKFSSFAMKSSGKFTSSKGNAECSSCSTHSCNSCSCGL